MPASPASSRPSSPAFPAAYLRYLPSVRAKCIRVLGAGGDADDVAHEAFVRLWESGPKVTESADPRIVLAWLYRTCTHLAIDVLRKRKRTPVRESPMDASIEGAPDCPCGVDVEGALAAKRVASILIERIATEELEAAILCRIDGLSQPEAATVLGVSERTVRRLLERFDDHAREWRQEFES